MARAKGWTCQKQAGGVKCKTWNRPGTRKCQTCGKPRPPKKRPAHMAALDYSYEYYIEINGGEHCGICGRGPKPGRRLDRDHDHEGNGRPRGLLCSRCNRHLKRWTTAEDGKWLVAAVEYLKRQQRNMV